MPAGPVRPGGLLMRPRRGQSTLEVVVLLAAVVSALVVMSEYVRRAFNAHGNALEEQLNGAVLDNAPGRPAGGDGGGGGGGGDGGGGGGGGDDPAILLP